MSEAWRKACEIRRYFGCEFRFRFPVREVAVWYGMPHNPDDGPEARFAAAKTLGERFDVDDPSDFAASLLAPLSLVEPATCHGKVKTGETWFFGLFEKTRGYTTKELAGLFDVPLHVIKRQLGKLL